MKTVTIRLDNKTIVALNRAAVVEGRTLSNMMRRMLQKGIEARVKLARADIEAKTERKDNG